VNHPLPTTDHFLDIVLNQTPLIDLRAPVEFSKGAFPHAVNLPLMSDEERHLVGICYKKSGNEKAVALGKQLVSGKVKSDRIQAWIDQIDKHPKSLLYCFRGGQRSQIAQQWLHEAGITVSRLQGGYKAFRNYLICQSEHITQTQKIFVIGGHTGSGKTILLQKLSESIDLEGLANHRGSSFGRYASPQPTQIDFENALAYALIAHEAASYSRLIIEDESRNIGKVYIPPALFAHFSQAPVILLEASLKERIEITYDEYILAAQTDYADAVASGQTPYSWIETMQHNFKRIRKRLGDQGYRALTTLLDEAWQHQLSTNDPTRHKLWIERLLRDYYDPMYSYQIEQKKDRIIFSGTQKEILDYLNEKDSQP